MESVVDEDCLNASKRRRIEESVFQILKTSDLETATELGIRTAAADKLGFDLSGVLQRRLVRRLVDSFLDSTANAILSSTSLLQNNDDNDFSRVSDGIEVRNEEKQQKQLVGGGVKLHHNYNGKVICKLSDKRMVSIDDFNGKTMVSIQDFYEKDGNMFPKTGISLTCQQWSSFKNSFPLILEAIAQLESDMRSEAVAEQIKANIESSMADSAHGTPSGADVSSFVTTVCPPTKKKQTELKRSNSEIVSNSEEHIYAERKQEEAGTSGTISTSDAQEQNPVNRKQTESDISTSIPAFPSKQFHNKIDVFHPEQMIPIQTTRLDGRNYHSWRYHMQLFLRQSNLAYVLVEPCPSVSLNATSSFDEKVKSKAAVQRWVYDDCMCHNNILNSLCDSLFQWYFHKSYSAKELWEELKLVYDEDFGTKRSQINKYIHFQMVDGLSIIEQVQELHKIANSVMASGTFIDENFHVSVIVSKLPASWKELRFRLMHTENLPLSLLMHHLYVEEESRNCYRKKYACERGHIVEPKLDNRFGRRKRENKRGCYYCGKGGHIAKCCPDQKFQIYEMSDQKENGIISLHTGTDAAEPANQK